MQPGQVGSLIRLILRWTGRGGLSRFKERLNGYKFLGKGNYTGETDPRKVPLCVAGGVSVLHLEKCSHLRLQDLAIRGSSSVTVRISDCSDIEFDNTSIYGGAPAMQIEGTTRLNLLHCGVRGLSAPWSSRASHKYRGLSPYLLIIAGKKPLCSDFTFAHCEFTDNHDGLILGTMKKLHFHHNIVENFDDDGLYLTLKRPEPPEDLFIYQNLFRRCLTTFAFAQFGKGIRNPVGSGVYICRNVFDLRQGIAYFPPTKASEDKGLPDSWNGACRLGGDHGSPVWETMFFYHNTVISAGNAFRGYYAGGLGGHTAHTKRRVFNNIFVQRDGNPGLVFPDTKDDFEADGNLMWGIKAGPMTKDFFTKWRASAAFTASKKRYKPGWGAQDLFADPKLTAVPDSVSKDVDVRLLKGSPAIDAGVSLPAAWFDPLKKQDKGKPDIGALPVGMEMSKVGR